MRDKISPKTEGVAFVLRSPPILALEEHKTMLQNNTLLQRLFLSLATLGLFWGCGGGSPQPSTTATPTPTPALPSPPSSGGGTLPTVGVLQTMHLRRRSWTIGAHG